MTTHEVCGISGLFRLVDGRVLSAAAILLLALVSNSLAATITVNSLLDTGATGICVLRDAITTANSKTARNGCIAGTGNDTINFTVTGTITLASTLPTITDADLAINGPASPGITLDGGKKVEVMGVAFGATVTLNKLTIANGFLASNSGGGIGNGGTLTINNCFFSGNSASTGGAISNFFGLITITNSTFSGNSAEFGGAIDNYQPEFPFSGIKRG